VTLQIAPAAAGFPLPNSEHLIFEGGSTRKKLLIVFAYINQVLGTRSHSSFLRNVDCKKLFLNPGKNEWYQTGVPGVADTYTGLLRFLQDVASDFSDHEIICLGHSMGGFAALGFGVSIGASRILASVPEVTLNVPNSLSIRHMKGVKLDCDDLTDVLAYNTRSDITALVGRRNVFDMGMGYRLLSFPRTDVIELDTGHNTFPYLKDVGKLGATLEAFVEGQAIRPILDGV